MARRQWTSSEASASSRLNLALSILPEQDYQHAYNFLNAACSDLYKARWAHLPSRKKMQAGDIPQVDSIDDISALSGYVQAAYLEIAEGNVLACLAFTQAAKDYCAELLGITASQNL